MVYLVRRKGNINANRSDSGVREKKNCVRVCKMEGKKAKDLGVSNNNEKIKMNEIMMMR